MQKITAADAQTTTLNTEPEPTTAVSGPGRAEILLCPLRHVLDIIGGKWKLPILCILADGTPRRYSEIKRKIPDITNMMLAQSLKELESHGIITRRQYNEVPPRVEYTIADDLDDLLNPLYNLGQWGIKHLQQAEAGHAACQQCRQAE